MKIPKTVGITDFRKNLSNYFKKAVGGEPVVISNSDRQVVMLDADAYNILVEMYEDYVDSEELTKAVKEAKDFVSFDAVKKKHKFKGTK